MYHNIMELQKNWYFIQVGPLGRAGSVAPDAGLSDGEARRVRRHTRDRPLDRLSAQHEGVLRSTRPTPSAARSFLERMGGSHVATLMDYSRFNYVAQPEDDIPLGST